MQLLLSLVELWSVGFWLLMLASAILFTVAAEKCAHGLALLVAVVLGVLYWNALVTTLPHMLVSAAIYLVAGSLYSLYRWRKHVVCICEEAKEKGMKPKEFDSMGLEPRWNKSAITAWILYWPFGLFWNLSGDFITKLYESLTNVYDSITKSVVSKY